MATHQPPPPQPHLWDGTPMAAMPYVISKGNDTPDQREHRAYEGMNMSENRPCQPMLMFDRNGNPRTRYVQVSHSGASMVMTPEDAQCFKEESEISGDETPYVLTDTYLSKQEFEDMPEFEGF